MKEISDMIRDELYIHLFNYDTDTKHILNSNCGAEYVQKDKKYPMGIETLDNSIKKFASFDGDADRLIYYVKQDEEPFVIDGDK